MINLRNTHVRRTRPNLDPIRGKPFVPAPPIRPPADSRRAAFAKETSAQDPLIFVAFVLLRDHMFAVCAGWRLARRSHILRMFR